MLTSFTPTKGPHATATYTFAREIGDIQRGVTFDMNSVIRLENQDGSYDMTGADRMFVDNGTIATTLDMNENWLKTGPMGDYVTPNGGNVFIARDKAIIDLIKYIVLGGSGKLVNTLMDGTVLWANAKINQYTIPYAAGQGTIRPQLSFLVLSGMWTWPDNSTTPLF